MSIAKTLKQYLDNKHIIYNVQQVKHFDSPLQAAIEAGISPRDLYYPIVLRDPFGLMMAILPASHSMDHAKLSGLLNRKVELAFHTQLSSVFQDCEPGMIPPIGEPYGIRSIIDAELDTPEKVYMVAGDNSRIIQLRRQDFFALQTNAWLVSGFTQQIEALNHLDDPAVKAELSEKNHYIRQRIEQITELPAMPEMGIRLMKLRADPLADISDLVEIVDLDPGLAAQVMRYARSPFFGCRGEINSLYEAVTRVLGFDAVMNLAMGVAMAKPFKTAYHGPIGMDVFWRQAVFSASLLQALAKLMPQDRRPLPGLCYLGGLLHDFGYLVLGHYFPEEFVGLSDLMLGEPETPHLALERRYLGTDHGELGVWLLNAWHLPEEVLAIVGCHHDLDYDGDFPNYVYLMQLVDCVLKNNEAGKPPTEDLPEGLVGELGIDEVEMMRVLDEILQHSSELDDMAGRLAAA